MMTCEQLERRLGEGMDRATANEARAHALDCERCAMRIVADAFARAAPPVPPAGFAHLTAVTARMTTAPAAPSHRGLRGAVIVAALYAVVAALLAFGGIARPSFSGSALVTATTGLLVAVEAAGVLCGLFVWSQAPPTRRRT
jgi:hypothetical protein